MTALMVFVILSTVAVAAIVGAIGFLEGVRSSVDLSNNPVREYASQCPRCGKVDPRRIDEEMVRCKSCGWKTDLYEAMKAAYEADADYYPGDLEVDEAIAVAEDRAYDPPGDTADD